MLNQISTAHIFNVTFLSYFMLPMALHSIKVFSIFAQLVYIMLG